MCGIAVAFSYGSSSAPLSEPQLRPTSDWMACRGPDGRGSWASTDGRVLLEHRRLAIIDLSERGAQPMLSADGKLAISFNGEIYNYRELRRELQKAGHHFRSDSDTEVLLHLYTEYGPEMVSRLRGMFAFAIWDDRKQGLLLVRDHFGIKPLYISDDGDCLWAASEVKALLRIPSIDKSCDPAGHVGFYLWGHVPEPFTLYRGIRSLPAGSFLWVSRTGERNLVSYASVTQMLAEAEASTDETRFESTGDQVREALVDSVRHHLIADVEVGVFLSSGIDSTTLAAISAEVGGRLRTVSLGFAEYRGSERDETPLAESVARQYGARHETVWITRQDFEAEFDRILERMDQPSIDGVNTYFVARAAAATGLKVALSGLGGDELFAGYGSFREIPRLVSAIGRVPGTRTFGKGLRALAAPVVRRVTSPKYAGVLEYGGDYAGAYLLRRGLFLPWELKDHFEPEFLTQGLQSLATLSRLSDTVNDIRSNRFKVSALETVWYMRNQLLRDTDWASMSHSLEVRVPLVDWTLWQTIARLIVAQPTVNKAMMANSPLQPLPASVTHRRKTGFTTPTRDWLLQRETGYQYAERGLRGWAHFVHSVAA